MPLIAPFAALRPAPGRAAEIAAPPYDVMSGAEARAMAAGRPLSFLHVSRAEIDLAAGTDPHAAEVYQRARDNFARLRAERLLIDDPRPGYYVYRLIQDGHRQTGLVAAASILAYERDRIKKHELTRPPKELDRARHIDALQAQTGPVFLVHRDQPRIEQLLDTQTQAPPEVDFAAPDGVVHQVWTIADGELIAALSAAVESIDSLYIADGHHRSAAAARIAADRRGAQAGAAMERAQWFLAVLFPAAQTRILPYNRVVRDCAGDTASLFAAIAAHFEIAPGTTAVAPDQAGHFGLYIDGRWYRLSLKPSIRAAVAADPVARLDASLLQRYLIGPVLGIEDPRADERIDFVGGSRGLAGLTARVDSGEMRLALALFPTRVADLLAVADAGAIMPPKSTWFEPKLADGLFCYLL